MTFATANGVPPGPTDHDPQRAATRRRPEHPSQAPSIQDGQKTRPRPRQTAAITCSGCTARWTGHHRAHCGSCHATFAAPGLFDRHWRTTGGPHGDCVPPASVGLRLVDDMWHGQPMTEVELHRVRHRQR